MFVRSSFRRSRARISRLRLRHALWPVLGVSIAAACERPLPSTTPLGGTEEMPSAESRPVRSLDGGADVAAEESKQAEGGRATTTGAGGAESGEDDGDASTEDAGADGDTETKDGGKKSVKASATAAEPKCQDEGGTPPECTPPDADECPIAYGICTIAGTLLKPRVAQALVECLEGDDDCGPDAPKRCFLSSIRKACVVPETRELCRDYLERCPEAKREDPQLVTESNCAHALSALKPDARETLTSCMKDQCELERCLEKLQPFP